MRIRLFCGTFALALVCATVGVAQDKSQQNAADEAAVKGDLDAAKKSGDPRKVDEAEKKLEQAVEQAKSKDADAGKPVQVGPRFTDLSEQQRRAIYQTVKRQQQSVQAPELGSIEVGAVLPPQLELHALPGDVTGHIPGTSTYRYVLSGDRVVLVEPTERIVLGVLGP